MCDRYVESLIEEIKVWGGRVDRPIDTLYIGGGTPSLLGDRIADVVKAVRDSFFICENAEITLEVNPCSAGERLLKTAKTSGVNRLSVGVQSGSNEQLAVLGRTHTVSDAENTVDLARKIGFGNISLDLMIALPGSTEKTLCEDIDFICSLNPEHISAYILKLEENTKLSKSAVSLPDDEQSAGQYLFMCQRLREYGYEQYEISNFAKGGFYSCHNFKYWNCGEYIGIGPSAHSFFEGNRFFYPPDLKAFLSNPGTVADGEGGSTEERLMLALRLSKGVDITDYLGEISGETEAFLCRLLKEKMITRNGNRIALTPLGMTVSNSIITELIYENF